MKHRIKVACSKDQLGLIRRFFTDCTKDTILPQKEVNLMMLAVDELCMNLMKHSHNYDGVSFITIKVDIKLQHVKIEVIDKGQGFDFTQYTPPKIEQVVRERRNGSMGLMLVRKIMDTIEFEQVGHKSYYRIEKNCAQIRGME